MKRILLILVTLCLLTTSALALGDSKSDAYNDACNLLSDGSYAEAATKFAELGEYQDASLLGMYCSSLEAAKRGQFALALSGFQALGEFRDSKIQALYFTAIAHESLEQYEEAKEILLQIPFFKDSNSRVLSYPQRINARDYAKADKAELENHLETALKEFTMLGNYSDSKARAKVVQEKMNARDYDTAVQAENDGDYETAFVGFSALGDYKDSKARSIASKDKRTYAQALKYALDGKFDKSYELFTSLGEFEDSAEKAYTLCVYQFANVTDINNGIAVFKYHDKYGIINVNTNTIASPCWDEVGTFDQNGLAKVFANEKYGYIDKNGKTIIACEWSAISDFSGGLCTVAQKSGKNYLFGIYDAAGKEISAPQWRSIAPSKNNKWNSNTDLYSPVINEDKIKVQNTDGLWGFINTKGEMVGEIRWESIEDFSENAAVIIENKKFGFLSNDGTILINPQYDEAYSYSDGLAAVKINGRWGFIDHTNTFVIPPIYGQVDSFNGGYADVYLNGIGWQIIDTTGTLQYFINEKTVADYETAITHFNNKEYRDAYALFSQLAGYKDSNAMAVKAFEKIKACEDETDGSVVFESYSPPLVASLYFVDSTYSVIDMESVVTMVTSGTYSIESSFTSTATGLSDFNLRVFNQESGSADPTNMKGRSIRIDEILINGKAISFRKNYTLTAADISEIGSYYYLIAFIYNDLGIDMSNAIAWDGDTAAEAIIVDTADFDAVNSIKVTFTYGIFK